MLGGLDYHTIAIAVKRALTGFASITNPMTTKGDIIVGTGTNPQTDYARKGAGTDGYVLRPSSGVTADALAWVGPEAFGLINVVIGTPVLAGNAMTIPLKGIDGSDHSDANPGFIAFRNVTGGTGTPTVLKLNSATSLAVSSGSSLGTANGVISRLWVVGFNDGGTFRLGVVNCLSGSAAAGYSYSAIRDNMLASSTAEGGAGGADSAQIIYTGTAVAAKAMRIIGFIEATQAAAGTWVTAPSKVQTFGPGVPKPGEVIQSLKTASAASVNCGANITPIDNTTPQVGEMNPTGLNQAVTPNDAANLIRVRSHLNVTHNAGARILSGIFQDAGANVVRIAATQMGTPNLPMQIDCEYETLAGATASTTFKCYASGNTAGTTFLNADAGAAVYNSTFDSYIKVEEIFV